MSGYVYDKKDEYRKFNFTHIVAEAETAKEGSPVPRGSYVFQPHRNSNPDKWAKEAYVQKHMDDLLEHARMLWNAKGSAITAGIQTDKRKARIANLSSLIMGARTELDKRRPIQSKNRMTEKTYDIVGKLKHSGYRT